MDEKVFQLIYASAEKMSFDQTDLEELLAFARKNNEKLGIRGLLIYDQGSFLQVLEGRERSVLALFEKIEKDPRHTEVKALLRKEVDKAQFDEWEMGFVNIEGHSELPKGYLDYKTELTLRKREGTLATRALESFLEGNWRSTVK